MAADYKRAQQRPAEKKILFSQLEQASYPGEPMRKEYLEGWIHCAKSIAMGQHCHEANLVLMYQEALEHDSSEEKMLQVGELLR